MIKKIERLENLGIYKNFNFSETNEFKKYNLIYGWNGSGKSTLTRLFSSFSGKDINKIYKNYKVTVRTDTKVFSEKELPMSSESIKIFNEDFIKENIDWNGVLKSILILDEDNIEEMKAYSLLKTELYGDKNNIGILNELKNREEDLRCREKNIQKHLTNVGKNVKNNLRLLDTTDSYYMNYDRRKVVALLEDELNLITKEDLIEEENLDVFIKQANPIKKERITRSINTININLINEEISKTESMLRKKVISKIIEDFEENPKLSSWVEDGLNLHRMLDRKKCSFCGGEITQERIETLENHFSETLNELKLNIKTLLDKWGTYLTNLNIELVGENDFYEEFLSIIKIENRNYSEISKKINNEIDVYIRYLEQKKENPFIKLDVKFDRKILINYFSELNSVVDKINGCITNHNMKTNNFEDVIKKAKKRLERHYIQEQISQIGYNEMIISFNRLKKDIEELKNKCRVKEKKYLELENKLSNETLGAEEFNKKLERFLGYGEIKLQFSKEYKGYRIYRNGIQEAKYLSEGEKTAIAFIYFITKIKENGSKIEDIILVIDDPISSFDSNKLFYAYAYMKSECDSAKQLFVLTHNYNFFSLIFGWFNKKHYKDKNGKKISNYCIYRIENKFEDEKRYAFLNNGGECLKQATEYDYIFNTIYSLKDKVLSKHEMIFCGNVARKLVESFLSFKFPKQRADLMALLNAAFPENEDYIVKERIYKFVNTFSHDKKINVYEELATDIFDSNSQAVINDILTMIEKLDLTHYNSMVDKAKEEIF